MKVDELHGTRKRLIAGSLGVILVLFIGAGGYYLLGQGTWSFRDCLYMTAITISTVGFSEVFDVGSVPGARLYTVLLVLFGMGIIIYFASTVVAFVVEGEMKRYFWRKRMQKQIDKITDHIILCGAGATGMYIIKELFATETPFVVIDEDEDRIKRLVEEETRSLPFVVGDASDDRALEEAGIQRARGLIAALPSDRENLLVVISARQLNPHLRIVSRGIEPTIADKLKRVGADAVVSSDLIGGMRMASEMIRPAVVEFLDLMLRDKDKNLRVEEVVIPAGSDYADAPLSEARVQAIADVLVVAARNKQGDYCYNPGPDFVLEEGATLIILGPISEVHRLREAMQGAERKG